MLKCKDKFLLRFEKSQGKGSRNLRVKNVLYLALLVLNACLVAACGGSSGGGAGTEAATLSADKSIALANTVDTISIKVTGPSEGTEMFLSAPLGVTLNNPSYTVGSTQYPAMTCATPGKYTILATSRTGNYAGTLEVRFISPPAKVDVSLALSPVVTNLNTIDLLYLSHNDATYINDSIMTVNAGVGSSVGILASNDVQSTGMYLMAPISGTGLNTGTQPILKLSYTCTPGSTTISKFQVVPNTRDNPPDKLSAYYFDPAVPNTRLTPFTPANLVLFMDYKDQAGVSLGISSSNGYGVASQLIQ